MHTSPHSPPPLFLDAPRAFLQFVANHYVDIPPPHPERISFWLLRLYATGFSLYSFPSFSLSRHGSIVLPVYCNLVFYCFPQSVAMFIYHILYIAPESCGGHKGRSRIIHLPRCLHPRGTRSVAPCKDDIFPVITTLLNDLDSFLLPSDIISTIRSRFSVVDPSTGETIKGTSER